MPVCDSNLRFMIFDSLGALRFQLAIVARTAVLSAGLGHCPTACSAGQAQGGGGAHRELAAEVLC
jgi:hypothetical protein